MHPIMSPPASTVTPRYPELHSKHASSRLHEPQFGKHAVIYKKCVECWKKMC